MSRRLAILIVVFLGASAPAFAQSEGDRLRALEELIAAQAAELERQAAVLDALRAELATLQAAATDRAEASASAVTNGAPRATLAVYGQVNRGVLYYSDGAGGDLRHVDNNASATRIGLRGGIEASPDLPSSAGSCCPPRSSMAASGMSVLATARRWGRSSSRENWDTQTNRQPEPFPKSS